MHSFGIYKLLEEQNESTLIWKILKRKRTTKIYNSYSNPNLLNITGSCFPSALAQLPNRALIKKNLENRALIKNKKNLEMTKNTHGSHRSIVWIELTVMPGVDDLD